MIRSLLTIFLTIMAISSASAWGKRGHDIVCHIAQRHLTAQQIELIEAQLDNHSMIYYASWADNAKYTKEYSYTRPWHYRNTELNESPESAKLNKAGDVVWAIDYLMERLAGDTLSHEERKVDLMLLIHLVGDLHQPLHAGRGEDKGGGDIPVVFFYESASLHSAWDHNMVHSAHEWSYTEWGEQIDRLSEAEREAMTQGTTFDWYLESYELSQQIYDDTAIGGKISYDYMAKYTPILEQQLLKAGVRLSYLLSQIY